MLEKLFSLFGGTKKPSQESIQKPKTSSPEQLKPKQETDDRLQKKVQACAQVLGWDNPPVVELGISNDAKKALLHSVFLVMHEKALPFIKDESYLNSVNDPGTMNISGATVKQLQALEAYIDLNRSLRIQEEESTISPETERRTMAQPKLKKTEASAEEKLTISLSEVREKAKNFIATVERSAPQQQGQALLELTALLPNDTESMLAIDDTKRKQLQALIFSIHDSISTERFKDLNTVEGNVVRKPNPLYFAAMMLMISIDAAGRDAHAYKGLKSHYKSIL